MSPLPPAQAAASVPVAPTEAFERFSDGLADWWPREYTWSGEALQAIAIEPEVGGMCFEVGPHGFRCDWGRVIERQPPECLSFTWQIGPSREPVPDPAHASEVAVTFSPNGNGACLVEVEHRGFERHGEGAGDYRDAMASEHGWRYLVHRFARSLGGTVTSPQGDAPAKVGD